MDSGGVNASQSDSKESPKPRSGPTGGNKDLIKAPPKETPQKIGIQYSDKAAKQEETGLEDDEDTQTILQCLYSLNKFKTSKLFNAITFRTVCVHTNYWAVNFNSSIDICIVYGG